VLREAAVNIGDEEEDEDEDDEDDDEEAEEDDNDDDDEGDNKDGWSSGNGRLIDNSVISPSE
jgi:hypothetical protein